MTALEPTGQRGWLRRAGWLLLIWAMSVMALGVVAAAFRALMGLAGLTA